MSNTKENILVTALRLFARKGYEAVSVSDIAGELGMTKSALYKHYRNKQDIFDSIVSRMSENDRKQAQSYDMPEETSENNESAYKQVTLEHIIEFSRAQFRYWTREDFSSDFRHLLTLEQYRDENMQRLYQQYLASGPMEYMEQLFYGMIRDSQRAKRLAMEFYAPIFMLYSIYDGANDKADVYKTLDVHLNEFGNNFAMHK